ncbi:glycosyltransferase [Pseudonocardia cypriaca]|uniref:glycosyltransferase n=1 Tax=Pseudonocardia cypriaca TaxID=882449 RepID=UPI001B86BB8F|nr:glycosyltransferase [Pseudonocardia cypriaca]
MADPALAEQRFPDVRVRPLWPSRLPAARTKWPRYAIPMMRAWSTARIEADALLVSSHFAAHLATRRFEGPSIVYYHTPARMLWRTETELARLPRAARRVVSTAVLPALRERDRIAAQHATVVLGNSCAVAERINAAYGRRAQVVHPPVDVARWASVPSGDRSHLLWLGRLVPYKRPDLAVEVARRTGIRLVVIGDGPERARLERDAPSHVRFLGHCPDHIVREAVAGARMLLFPGEEDFGIAPVEALAAGVPVIALASGGALDYVRQGLNGLLVGREDPDEFAAAIRSAWSHSWDERAIRRSADAFSVGRFRAELASVLDVALGPAWRTSTSPSARQLAATMRREST